MPIIQPAPCFCQAWRRAFASLRWILFPAGSGRHRAAVLQRGASDRAAVPRERPAAAYMGRVGLKEATERARPVSILTESGRGIAPRRLRRSALRSASGDGQCSYTPAPSRALYGLVARPALSCLSDNTQSGSNNRNRRSNNRNPAFDNTQSGSQGQTRKRIRIYSP